MKKTLLICTVLFLGLGASAQVKKEAVQTAKPLTAAVSIDATTDKRSARKAADEKQMKLTIQRKQEAERQGALLLQRSSSKRN